MRLNFKKRAEKSVTIYIDYYLKAPCYPFYPMCFTLFSIYHFPIVLLIVRPSLLFLPTLKRFFPIPNLYQSYTKSMLSLFQVYAKPIQCICF